MKIPLNVLTVFGLVTAMALGGMVLGGAFGYAAGLLAPDLFAALVPWEQLEPVGTATMIGAFGGTLCGGGLGVFAVMVQFLVELRRTGRTGD